MEKYTILIDADEDGYVTAKRVRDGKTARVKASWLKLFGGGDYYVPKSRTRAIRLGMMDWE